MGLFSKKEKSLIPEVEKPGSSGASSTGQQSSGRGSKVKPGEPDTEVRDRRYGGRTAPSYNPGQTPGSYGGYNQQQQQPQQPAGAGYGNYGQQPQSQGQGGSLGGPHQGAGYGAYGNPNSANPAYANARAPNRQTGSAFDDYAGVRRPTQPRQQQSYGAEYGDNADPYAGGGSRSGAAYGDNPAEGGDEANDGQEQGNEEDDEVYVIETEAVRCS